MFTRISRIACAPVVVAFGVVLASATVYAGDDTTGTEHAKQMVKGKTHEDAVRATQPKADAEKIQSRAKGHEEAMKKGKTHEDAVRATEPKADAEKVQSRAKKHEEAMKKGKTHEDAVRAAESQ